MVYITFGNKDITVGKLIIHREKIANGGGKNASYTMEVSHSEIGKILSTGDLVQAVEIKDDDNFFAHLICPRPELETFYDYDGSRQKFLGSNIVVHMQRNGETFERKFTYNLSAMGIEDEIRDAGLNAVLLSSFNRFVLYSLRLNEVISPDFLECTDFTGEDGLKRASFAIPIPNSYDKHLPCTVDNISAVRPNNYLLGVIDENGNYVAPIINLLTGEEYYDIARNTCDGNGLSVDKLIHNITEEEEKKAKNLADIKQRLLERHIKPE